MQNSATFISNKSHIKYFSGFTGSKGYLVFVGNKKYIFVDARYHLVAKAQCPKFEIIDTTKGFAKAWKAFLKEHKIKKIGFEGTSTTFDFWKKLKKISRGAKLFDFKNELNEKRTVKNEDEIEKLTRAQNLNDKTFAAVKKWLKRGVSEKEIAWKIKDFAHSFGADGLSFESIVAINEHSAAPHHQNGDRKLKRGDLILIDMGVSFGGYCSDMSRMIFTREPTKEEAKVYNTVLAAQNAAIRKIKSGVTGQKIEKIAHDVIEKAGLGKLFTHALGHGVGIDIHELPNLSKLYNKKIPKNAVVTVEPGVYIPEKFGVRIEDMVIVQKNKAFNLTKTDKKLKSCLINI